MDSDYFVGKLFRVVVINIEHCVSGIDMSISLDCLTEEGPRCRTVRLGTVG